MTKYGQLSIIPAKGGIQVTEPQAVHLDPRFREGDEELTRKAR